MTPESRDAPPEYDLADLEMMREAMHYRRWMYGLIAPFIGRRVLEVGAGIGNYSEFLVGGDALTLLDSSTGCCEALRERFALRNDVHIVQMDICDPIVLTLKDSHFDTIICLDVLEHTDDALALRHMNALLPESGILILKVPALQSLHGTIDRALGHHRRYRRRELLGILKRAGFLPDRCQYINLVGALGWWVNSHVLRRQAQSPIQVRLYDRFVVPLASRVEALWRPPFGQSLLAICRKTSEVISR